MFLILHIYVYLEVQTISHYFLQPGVLQVSNGINNFHLLVHALDQLQSGFEGYEVSILLRLIPKTQLESDGNSVLFPSEANQCLTLLPIKATEETPNAYFSEAVVIVPLAGDDHNPQLDKERYETKIIENGNGWTLSPSIDVTATDDDKLIENKCNFELIDNPGDLIIRVLLIQYFCTY